jgi:hypothetical protein
MNLWLRQNHDLMQLKRAISFISAENSRAEKGEIASGTVGNALKRSSYY